MTSILACRMLLLIFLLGLHLDREDEGDIFLRSVELPRNTTQKTSFLHEALCYKPENVDSIPDEFIGFFNSSNPSSRTMALRSTQPLTEMSTRTLPGAERAAGCQPDRHL
jgi:hypothetical protein